MKKQNKKAAVEMSLNLIIMLIIGMVVLGLIIGFVNSLVNKGTESFDKQLGDNEKLKLEEIKNCADNLCINPSPSTSVKLGSETNLFIKVRAYSEDVDCGPGELMTQSCFVTYNVVDADGNDASNQLLLKGPGFSAKGGLEDAQMYSLSTGEGAALGTYYLTLGLYGSADSPETKKVLTIELN